MHVPTRAGGDIVFLGALINHVLSGGHEFREYVRAYTNAADILPEDFTDAEDGGGLFSGYDPETRTYDNASWQPTGERDETLTHPRCVFQVLKRHFARYTPELAEQVCGIRPGRLRQDRRRYRRSQRPGEDDRVGVRGGLDPAQHRRAAHQGRVDPADAARQHGPSRRRHPGAARARQHPGRDRRADPVPPARRLPADAGRGRGHGRATWPGSRTPASGATSASTWSAC